MGHCSAIVPARMPDIAIPRTAPEILTGHPSFPLPKQRVPLAAGGRQTARRPHRLPSRCQQQASEWQIPSGHSEYGERCWPRGMAVDRMSIGRHWLDAPQSSQELPRRYRLRGCTNRRMALARKTELSLGAPDKGVDSLRCEGRHPMRSRNHGLAKKYQEVAGLKAMRSDSAGTC